MSPRKDDLSPEIRARADAREVSNQVYAAATELAECLKHLPGTKPLDMALLTQLNDLRASLLAWHEQQPNHLYEYTINYSLTLTATDEGHACEEAGYICEGCITSVVRGDYLGTDE